MEFREFSGGLVVTTGHLHCWGPWSCAGCENLNLASWACGMAGVKKKKKRLREFKNCRMSVCADPPPVRYQPPRRSL